MKKLSIASAVDKLIKNKTQPESEKSIEEAVDQEEEYVEDDLPDEEVEEADPSKKQEILQKVSTDVETLVDDVMAINDNKEYSKLIKLLQSAVRLADELLESDDLLNQ
jgi:hypothetical protein